VVNSITTATEPRHVSDSRKPEEKAAVSAQDYSLAATMKALRAIVKENQDKPIEARWA
jgi:hypothetical protein